MIAEIFDLSEVKPIIPIGVGEEVQREGCVVISSDPSNILEHNFQRLFF